MSHGERAGQGKERERERETEKGGIADRMPFPRIGKLDASYRASSGTASSV